MISACLVGSEICIRDRARPYLKLLKDHSDTIADEGIAEPPESDSGRLPSVDIGSSADGIINDGAIGIPIDDDGLVPFFIKSSPKEN